MENELQQFYDDYDAGKFNIESHKWMADITKGDILRIRLMKHVNGIGQHTQNGEIQNHMIDLKFLIDKLHKFYENNKVGKFKDKDLLRIELMKHVNGIGQHTHNGKIQNHMIDLKLLIDTI